MIPGLTIEWESDDSEHFASVLRLLFAVLYRDFGVKMLSDWYHVEPGVHAVALYGGRVVGTARLLGGPGDRSRQVRQVAVEPAMRGNGIGATLVHALEVRAASEGAQELWLNSRDTAFGFYERLGYRFDGEPFVSALTGILHRRMVKRLTLLPS